MILFFEFGLFSLWFNLDDDADANVLFRYGDFFRLVCENKKELKFSDLDKFG